jgi:hypothetical protein
MDKKKRISFSCNFLPTISRDFTKKKRKNNRKNKEKIGKIKMPKKR